MGPTASGKTDVAVFLAERLGCAVVSVDSAMVYREMDVGTAKPPPGVLARVPHRLIDILDPAEAYSAARFRADALREIAEARSRGQVPLLVGGTGLYFRALERGLSVLPAADPGIRAGLTAAAAREGWPALHARLARVDPAAASRIHPNDPQRIQRALEVYQLTGRPLSALLERDRAPAVPFRVVKLVLVPASRGALHERIGRRFEQMLAIGLLEEVERLRGRGDLHPDLPSMRSVGYRQVWRYLDGATDRATMVQRGVAATRQLAKRQLTWLRAESEAERIDSLDPRVAERALDFVSRVLAPPP
jgi:tRNA dimethylallyltransferase